MNTEIQLINLPLHKPLSLFILRLDHNDTLISGNKAYKLRPWINQAVKQNKALISCGGAFSNHLHALAAAGYKYHIPTYGLVRALEIDNPTITMQDCMAMGMTLIPISRQDYKKRNNPQFLMPYQAQFKQHSLWIAEGGMGDIAITACEEIAVIINQAYAHHEFNSVYLAVGSGGTLAGIARRLDNHIQLYAVPVMKDWLPVKTNVEHYLSTSQAKRIIWLEGGSYGGFGKANRQHIEFLAHFEALSNVLLDPVYTSKVVRKIVEQHLAKSNVGSNHKPLIIHTGGLQGRRSVADKISAITISPEYFEHLTDQYI